MSDTPRTDAMIIRTWGSLKPFDGHPVAEFARKLERELARTDELLAHYTYAAPQAPESVTTGADRGLETQPAAAAPDTPRTDSLDHLLWAKYYRDDPTQDSKGYLEMTDYARLIERELNEERQRADWLDEKLARELKDA